MTYSHRRCEPADPYFHRQPCPEASFTADKVVKVFICRDVLNIPAAGDSVKLWVQMWAGSDIRLSLGLKYKDIVRLLKLYLPSFAVALAASNTNRQVILPSIKDMYSNSSYKGKNEPCPCGPLMEIHYVQLELLLTGCIFQLWIWVFLK